MPIQETNIVGNDLTGAALRVATVPSALGPALVTSASFTGTLEVNLDLANDEVAIGGPDAATTRRLFQGRADGPNNVQETVPRLVGAQGDALGKAEDSVHASGDVGIMALAVRNDAGTAIAADGDYIPLTTDATGQLRTSASFTGTIEVNLDLADDEVMIGTLDPVAGRQLTKGQDDGGGRNRLVVATDAAAPLAVSDNGGSITVDGTVAVGPTVTPGTGATDLGKAEDAVAASGDVGVMALSVRRDADAPDAADGDYVPLHTDATGRLKTSASGTVAVGPTVTPGTGATDLGKAEDAVAGSGDVGVMALAVRRDAKGANAADGDYASLLVDDVGYLKTNQRPGATGATTVVAVAAASVALAAASGLRRGVTVHNRGPGPLYINVGAAALVTNYKLNVGDNKTFDQAAGAAVNGISNAAGASAVVITEAD